MALPGFFEAISMCRSLRFVREVVHFVVGNIVDHCRSRFLREMVFLVSNIVDHYCKGFVKGVVCVTFGNIVDPKGTTYY